MKIAARMKTAFPIVKWPLTALLCAVAAGCGGSGGGDDALAASCPAPAALEAQMDAVLSQAVSEVPFSFAVERQDGHRYNFNRVGSTLQTLYESKSASKLVSAIIILRLVEQGYLNLADTPQDRIGTAWPIVSPNPLSAMTLAQLLSFTSGLTFDPPCLGENSDFEACVITVANSNADNGNVPGQEFVYGSSHLQVAGLMAMKARGFASWQAIVAEFKGQTGLFPTSIYDSPSSSNPSLAGGMHFTGQDYMDFLKALKGGSLLNIASSQLLTDHTASVRIAFSPMLSGIGGGPGLGEDWHYGFGLWHECQSPTFNCVAGTRVSSPGARGSYPFWDRSKGYTGIVVLNGVFGTDLLTGINIERSVRPIVEQWAAC